MLCSCKFVTMAMLISQCDLVDYMNFYSAWKLLWGMDIIGEGARGKSGLQCRAGFGVNN